MPAHSVDQLLEAIDQFGSWSATDGDEFDAAVTRYPEIHEHLAAAFSKQGANLDEAIQPQTRDMFGQLSSSTSGLGGAARDLIDTHRREHGFWKPGTRA